MKFKLVFFMCLFLITPTASAHDIGLYIDGEEILTDTSPIIENDRTLVPVRGIFEHINAEVGWNDGIVTISSAQATIVITIGEGSLLFNGAAISLDVPAKIENDRTYIPLRAVSSLMNCEVVWDEDNRNVYIYYETMPPVSDRYNYLFEYEVYLLINDIRRVSGMPELSWSRELASAARRHAEDMEQKAFFDHINPDGQSPFDRMNLQGIVYMYAAENIAVGYGTPKETVDGWMNSDSHRENILNPEFTKIGVGYYSGYWCQEFTD